MEKLKIRYPIIVEGKYDKIKLDSILDANIIKTDGFGVFKKNELAAFIRRLASECGKIIVLTDSDGAGRLIRSHIKSIVPPANLIDLYTPDIKGKEKRKTAPSAAGLLGVEGMDADFLRELFMPYSGDEIPSSRGDMTKFDFYNDGLSGRDGAQARREKLCEMLSLPREMSAGALLAALNMLKNREQYEELIEKLDGGTPDGE